MQGGLESHYSNTQGYLTYLPWTKHSSRLTVSGPLIPPQFALRILTPQQASLHSQNQEVSGVRLLAPSAFFLIHL